ncbi:MAG: KOW domain-containing RNA-binding protein [Defluviitaleaceae bacterium]|nr:KOW domain-containing RNA-binding protein [Defluviitaleaceae bacterium]
MEFAIGQVVISKAGRDKGNVFIVYNIDEEYLYLVDGRSRPLKSPKKKKIKHIQPTKTINADLHRMILEKEYIKNADFRTALKIFMEKREENANGER